LQPPLILSLSRVANGNVQFSRLFLNTALAGVLNKVLFRPEGILMDLCAMTWCISHTCITCSFLTGTKVPCTDGGDRTEGVREALPGSTGWGYHQQSGLKCTGLRTIMRKAGLPKDVW
jgi:hypothetical protein